MNKLKQHVRAYLESGRLSEQSFAELCLMYSVLSGVEDDQLRKYEQPDKGWSEVFSQLGR